MTDRPILLVGSTGQLGWELHRCLISYRKVVALDFPEINLAEPESIRSKIHEIQPSILINAAAYTKVDKAENEPDLAHAVNAAAPRVMAEEGNRLGCLLIHFSTDYIFDGRTNHPYREDDPPHPLNVYGATKLEGEQAIQAISRNFLIFRTSWLYSMRRESFISKVLEWASHSNELRIVDDQISSPTWARMLAQAIAHIISASGGQLQEKSGVYHLCGSGYTNRLVWAKTIVEIAAGNSQSLTRIQPAKTEDFPSPAQRPLFSALDCHKVQKTFSICLPDWMESLKLAMAKV